MGDDSELTAAPVFKKKAKTSQQNTRKRTIDSDVSLTNQHEGEQPTHPTRVSKADESHQLSQQEPIVKFHRRKNRTSFNPLYQATGTSSKRLKANDDQSSSDGADGSESDDEQKAVGVSYKAQGSARQQAEENLQKSILEKKQPILQETPDEDDPLQDQDQGSSKIYLGQSKSKYQLPKGSMKYGPIKGGPTNIQTITVVDYQPDVCKDYKETGYCGFGDTCKFLHDRGDYMHGWQLDDAFNSRNKKAEVESEEEEEVPFACLICRQPFTDPVVTKCRHYFCSSCAIKRFAKTPKCFACGAPTGGIFNKFSDLSCHYCFPNHHQVGRIKASRVIEKMKLKQERIKRQKEERRIEAEGLTGIEGLEDQTGEGNGDDNEQGSERSFYEDE